jgi:ribose transport system permease protein
MTTTTPDQVQTRRSIGSRISNEMLIVLLMFIVLILLVTTAWIFVPGFAQGQTLVNLVTNNWYIVILGIGVTFLLITKNFDLSVGGIVALTGVLSVYFSQAANVSQNELANGLGLPYPVAIILALLGAMSIGALNAFFVVRLKVPSIIVTLGTMTRSSPKAPSAIPASQKYLALSAMRLFLVRPSNTRS